MTEAIPTQIGTDRQLFVDDYWVAHTRGCARRLHQPVRCEAAVVVEHPWEQGLFTYNTVFKDGGRYRMYYRCGYKPRSENPDGIETITAYAESKDGIHWEKPTVGLIDVHGSRDNNLVWIGPGTEFAPFRDDSPNARQDQRYKAVVRVRREGTTAMLALASPDGLRWSLLSDEPILSDPPFDTHNVPFWDSWRGEYVIYCRGSIGTSGPFKGGFRWIRRATSRDFLHWSPLELIDTGDKVFEEHLYTNACVQYERAPGTYLMFPSRFVPERSPTPDWPEPGVNDIIFMSSRDGFHFDRSFKEAYLRPGLDRLNWHERAVYMERGILQTSPTELSLFVIENGHLPSVTVRRYTVRTDGFVSVNAGYAGGEFTTRPLVFEGNELELNYSTSAVGSVRVEMQDAEGRPRPGFALDDCPEMFGDEIDGVVRWTGGGNVDALAGNPVRLRFALKDADLYAYRFRGQEGMDG